ncbi:hypothetical protein EJ08DRAFT_649166 [Tothia fuscella]|uniref:Uncharacterized protein n=1 Tax=Tothia fuscella TaxID=1048955 RepID=A0A9P4NSV5_9PEZI|nr:hypothetical protein EJ08DRAFT_649166 [Tothia fuscella]
MHTYAIISLAFAALASAQSSASVATTSVPYENPLTEYLTQTNSLGVITGMPTQPAVVTSIPTQPAVVTSQPILDTIYAGLSTGLNTVLVGNATQTVLISSGLTSVIKSTPKPTAASTSGGPAASGTGAAASASSSGSSAASHMKAGAGALLGAGAFAALFL